METSTSRRESGPWQGTFGGPDIPGRAPEGRAVSANICDEAATRREGGQPAAHRWHTLVSCTLTTEYRPVRPLARV
jgi:hypothetical protein